MPISVTIIEGELKYLEYLKILLSHSRDLACAEGLNVDYFITCDDKIIKKYCGKIKIRTPVEFITNILKENKDDTN